MIWNEIMNNNCKNLLLIIISSVITKVIVASFTIILTGGLNDTYDYSVYYQALHNILNLSWPWANNVVFYYPPLSFIPILISYIPSLIYGFEGFVVAMQIQMILCDIGISVCVYYIAKKIYNDHNALISGILCATSIPAAYYVFFRFDALPTLLMVASIMFIIYGYEFKGYILTALGLFTKLFPFITIPFLLIYNKSKNGFFIACLSVAAFVSMILIGYNGFMIFANEMYVNTIPYLFHAFTNINMNTCSMIFHILTGIVILYALYTFWKNPKNIHIMLQMILISLVAVIYLYQYRSPQYLVWIIPIASILVASDGLGILSLILLEILSFVEYPFTYGMLYENHSFIYPSAIWLFIIIFSVLIFVVYRCSTRTHPG